MRSMKISTSQVTYHLALFMVFTFLSLSGVQDAALSYYHDFGFYDKLPANKFVSPGYNVSQLRNYFHKFNGSYPDLTTKY